LCVDSATEYNCHEASARTPKRVTSAVFFAIEKMEIMLFSYLSCSGIFFPYITSHHITSHHIMYVNKPKCTNSALFNFCLYFLSLFISLMCFSLRPHASYCVLGRSMVKVKVMLRLTISRASLSWCQAPIWGPKTRLLLLSNSCGFVDVRRHL
jgi:hypothetical protein